MFGDKILAYSVKLTCTFCTIVKLTFKIILIDIYQRIRALKVLNNFIKNNEIQVMLIQETKKTYCPFMFGLLKGSVFQIISRYVYTLFQNGRHFSGLLFTCKLSLVASFLKSKFKRIFSYKRGNKG